MIGAGRSITILSSVHQALDNRVFYREARTLARAGYEVTLIAVHDRREVRDGVQILPLPQVARSRRPLLWREIVRMVRQSPADVYLFHDPELLLLTPQLRRISGRPTIYDIHEANADFIAVKDYLPTGIRGPLAGMFRRLEPQLASHESGLIFADEAIARDFSGIIKPKITLFNYPGEELISAGASAAPAGTRDPVALYLGGMERNRGAALLVEAWTTVVEQMPEARLLLVGHFMPPELESEVRVQLAERGVGHTVEITGRVPFARVGDYLGQARAGWVTWQPVVKNRKNIPTKLFEYMAFGLPVVSSNLPSTRPFVWSEVNGLAVAADDPADHAAALLKILGDPATATRLGQAGQLLVRERWNWKSMEPRLIGLIEAVLDSHN